MKIGIIKYPINKEHSSLWNKPWIEYSKTNDLRVVYLNPFDYHIIDKLSEVDVLLWHLNGYNYTDMLIGRNILYTAKKMGKIIFPDLNDAWHFDDKIGETYFLQSVKAPIPNSYLFYRHQDLMSFANVFDSFPIIAKLRNGSGSHNVKKINSSKELLKYSSVMFNKGFPSSPSLLYKSSSNIKSAKSLKTIFNRAKRIPEFLRTLKNSKVFPNEKGYVFLQEFIQNDGYDLKIVVVGEKLSFIGRNIRKGDFRASGGGDLFYDKKYITKDIIDSAFKTSKDLGVNCMGYDYVVDKFTGKGYIIEISFGFSHEALLEAKGLLPKVFLHSKSHQTLLLNILRCESHREIMTAILERDIN
jgi:glutathione synthase/RimK-type ligase-like ATP-grasp enzyme